MSIRANNKSSKYFYKQTTKTCSSAFIIFIMLLIYLPAYSATLVEEEEVKSPEIVQEITDSNEINELQPQEKLEEKSAEISGQTAEQYNNKTTNNEPYPKTSGNDDGVAAGLFAVFVCLSIGLSFGGFALRSNIVEKYEYDIFSIGNILIACIASFFLLMAVFGYNEYGMSSGVVVFIFFALICYAFIFAIIVNKTDVVFATISVLYLFVISVIIVLVAAFFVLRWMGGKKGK